MTDSMIHQLLIFYGGLSILVVGALAYGIYVHRKDKNRHDCNSHS